MKREDLIGQSLGGYEVTARLGAGGMGAVYLARDLALEKTVALKVLPEATQGDDEATERFRREARIAASLEHPNIVPIYRFGEDEGLHYLVMRFVEGESLADRLQRTGPLPVEEALFITYEVAKGLERAHEAGLIHRDIKPANILLSERSEVLVADFGLAKRTGDAERGLTATGMILGTPDYMAPEQCEGQPDVDGRADIFSLGLVLYTMLCGVVPSKGTTPLQVIMNRVQNPVPPIREACPQVSAALSQTLDRVLERDRDCRLGTAAELLDAIEALPEFQLAREGGMFRSAAARAPSSSAEVSRPVRARLIAASADGVRVTATSPTTPLEPIPQPEVRVTPKAQARPTMARVVPQPSKARLIRTGPTHDGHNDDGPRPAKRSSTAAIVALLVLAALFGFCCLLAALDEPPMPR